MKVKILTIGAPTRDGTVYSREVIEQTLAHSKDIVAERELPVRVGSSKSSKNVIGHVSSLALEGDDLMAEIDVDLSRADFDVGGYIAKVRDGDHVLRVTECLIGSVYMEID
jgi:hypothetical protein